MVAASVLDRLNQLGGVGESHQWPMILSAKVVTSMIINPLTVLTLYVLPFAEGSWALVEGLSRRCSLGAGPMEDCALLDLVGGWNMNVIFA